MNTNWRRQIESKIADLTARINALEGLPPDSARPGWTSIKEAAYLLGVSEGDVRYRRDKNQLIAKQNGGRWYIKIPHYIDTEEDAD